MSVFTKHRREAILKTLKNRYQIRIFYVIIIIFYHIITFYYMSLKFGYYFITFIKQQIQGVSEKKFTRFN